MSSNHSHREGLSNEPFWYKSGVIYELHVRAFHDSDGDGVGDFRGLTEKLDYLKDLGVTAVWLLPFYPSPLKDDGYDIADYLRRPPELRHAGGLQGVPARGPPARAAGHHRAGVQPHLRPASVVSARAAAPSPAAAGATSTSGATRPTNTRAPASSSRTSRPPTGPGTTWPGPITGTASSRTSRT